MRKITINAVKRESKGKSDAKSQRKSGMVPCVVYGGEENLNVLIDERDFKQVLYTPEVFNIQLSVDGTEYSTVLQDTQFHPVTDKIIHADFLQVNEEKDVTVAMAVMLKGSAIGVRNGGKLKTPMRKLRVSGKLADLPDGGVDINIEDLRIGQAIKVGSLEIAGVKFLDPASNVVVAVKTARGAVLDEEEEGGEEASEEAAAE